MLLSGAGLELRSFPYRSSTWSGRIISVSAPKASAIAIRHAESPARLRTLAPSSGPFVAVNGGFYDRDGKAMGVVVSDGTQRRPWSRGGGSGVLAIADGAALILHRDEYKRRFADKRPAQALQSIDRLVDDGRNLVRQRGGMRRTARVAIVIDARNTVSAIVAFDDAAVVASRSDGLELGDGVDTTGPTLWEWGALLARGGDFANPAKTALNLDGGRSVYVEARLRTDSRKNTHFRIESPGRTINSVVIHGSD